MDKRRFCAMVIGGVLATPVLQKQEPASALSSAYGLCIAEINKEPLAAYNPCKQYLETQPHDDTRRSRYVRNWLASYEKAQPYISYLEGLSPDKNASWIVYGPDTSIPLPETSDTEGAYKIEIARTFANSDEETMLREAEAIYPGPKWMIEEVARSFAVWAATPPEEMAPIWGMPGNDRLQEDEIVTARAVRYYYDLSLAAKANPHLSTGFDAQQTELKYEGVIKHYDRYVHKKDSFQNVYVADLTLKWSFTCGGLCGMGFTRNKVVVLDSRGNIIALYLDSPVNSTSWVS